MLDLAVFPQRVNVFVVWVSSESEGSAVDHKVLELLGLTLAKLINCHFLLLFLDVIIFLILGSTWKALPRQGSSQEVEKHVTDSLKIVSPGLLISNMGVDTSISGSSSQVLSFSEGDMLTLRVLVALGKSKVNNVNIILSGVRVSNQEVVWLNISMDNALFVHFLNSLDHLSGNAQNGLKVELAAALLEQVL